MPASHQHLLKANQSAVLATVNRDGSPHTSVVWSMVDDAGLIVIAFSASGHKHRNLTRMPVASLLFVDPSNVHRTLEVRAAVSLAADDAQRTMTRAIIASYGIDPMVYAASIAEERTVATLHPTRVRTIG